MSMHRRSTLGRRRPGRETDEDTDSDGPQGSGGSLTRMSRRQRRRTRKRQQMHAPEMVQSKEEFIADWGITPEEEEQRVRALQKRFANEGLITPDMPPYYHDYYTIRRFVRARQHDLDKAYAMLSNHIRWRKDVGADDILETLQYTERDSFLTIYPQGYHKTDKMGRPVYIQKMGAINLQKILEVTTEERMIAFRIQEWERCLRYIMPSCSKVAGRKIEQTFAILDVQGVGLRHFTGDVKRLMAKVTQLDQDNYPEMLGHTCIINAPAVFKVIWGFAKPLLDARTQAKVEFCPRDYTSALLRWVDKENLPTYLGGTSTGTLLEDLGPWNRKDVLSEVETEYRRACGNTGIDTDDEVSTTSDIDDRRASSIRLSSRRLSAVDDPNAVTSDAEDRWNSRQHSNISSTAADAEVATQPRVAGSPGHASFSVTAATSDVEEGALAKQLPPLKVVQRTTTHYSTADEGDDFHSPRSVASNMSFMSATPSFAVAPFDYSKVDALGTVEQNGYYQPLEGHPHSPERPTAGLVDRIHKLEQRLSAVGGAGPSRVPAITAGTSLTARVSNLEHAMEALLAAKEAELAVQQDERRRQQEAEATAEQKGMCRGCCCIQ